MCGFVDHLQTEPSAWQKCEERESHKPSGAIVLGKYGKFQRAIEVFTPTVKCSDWGIIARAKKGCGVVIIAEVVLGDQEGLIPNTNKVTGRAHLD